jgi:hypothetical protein
MQQSGMAGAEGAELSPFLKGPSGPCGRAALLLATSGREDLPASILRVGDKDLAKERVMGLPDWWLLDEPRLGLQIHLLASRMQCPLLPTGMVTQQHTTATAMWASCPRTCPTPMRVVLRPLASSKGCCEPGSGEAEDHTKRRQEGWRWRRIGQATAAFTLALAATLSSGTSALATEGALRPQESLAGCSAKSSCVSTSALNAPSAFMPPWIYAPLPTSVAYKQLLQELDSLGATIVRADEDAGAIDARIPYGNDVDEVSFIFREERLVLFRWVMSGDPRQLWDPALLGPPPTSPPSIAGPSPKTAARARPSASSPGASMAPRIERGWSG